MGKEEFIEVLSGPEDGKYFELKEKTVTIGRLDGNDICIPLELSVSRRHARLVRDANGYELEIFEEARNAATVADQFVAPGHKARLQTGEIFRLGDVQLRIGSGTEC